jgi:tRNA nucleotidyltransferase (CCA-adding enzyme)
MANDDGHATSHWEHFAHEADMGVRGIGSTCADAFEQAALALSGIVTNLAAIRPEQKVEITCAAPDAELLLVDWLNAIIFEMATRHMLFSRYDVQMSEGKLLGTAWGEAVEPARHLPAVEPKGATYTSLSVREEDGRWLAQCVVDV